jgi:branched-chain amino acid transport system substrate-binding protein
MKRTMVIVCMAALVLGAALPLSAGGAKETQAQPTEFKLGFMTSLSGAFAVLAETQRKGTELAVAEVNARGGLNMPWGKVPVKLLTKDDESKLDVGVRRYRELVEAGINGFTGTCYNPMAAALNEESKLNPLPMIAACVPAIDSFKKGNPAPGSFSVAFTPWSIGYLAGQSVVKGMGAQTIFFVSRSDSWGTTIYDGLKAALAEVGGKVVGFEEYPLGNVDFSSAINKAIAAKPDVFVAVQTGADAVALYKQAYDMGLMDATKVFNAWTMNYVAKGIPRTALEKMTALTFHYYDVEGGVQDKALVEKTKKYTEAHEKMFGGEPPDAYTTLAYMAASILLEAVEKAGSFDVNKVSEVLASATFDTVKGKAFFREDHELVNDYLAYLVRGKGAAEASGEWDLYKVENYFGGQSALPPLKMLGY